jgi:hypothetical protein
METENTNYSQTDLNSTVGKITFPSDSSIIAGDAIFDNLYVTGNLHVASNNGNTAKLRIILNLVIKGHIDSNVKLKNTINLYGFEIDEKIIKDVFTKLTEKHITVDEALVLMNYNEKDTVDTYKPLPYMPTTPVPFYPYNYPTTAKPIEIYYEDAIKTAPKAEWIVRPNSTGSDVTVKTTTNKEMFRIDSGGKTTLESTVYNSTNRE